MLFRVHLEGQVLQNTGVVLCAELTIFVPDHGLNSSLVTDLQTLQDWHVEH